MDLVVVGSQYFVGDDANQNEKLPSYWVTNLHTSYDLSKNVRIFGLVNNLFNQTYYPYGTYFDPQSVQNAIPTALTDQRTLTPGPAAFGLRRTSDPALNSRISATLTLANEFPLRLAMIYACAPNRPWRGPRAEF